MVLMVPERVGEKLRRNRDRTRPRALLQESELVSKNELSEMSIEVGNNSKQSVHTCSVLVLDLVPERGKCFNDHFDEVEGRTLAVMSAVEFINEAFERAFKALFD